MRINKTLVTMVCAGFVVVFAAGEVFAQPPGFGGGFPPPGGFNPGGDRGDRNDRGNNETDGSTGNTSVTAVADERSNSVVISAPEELWPMIDELIAEVDGILERTAAVEVFPLRYADAEEMADLVESMFEENSRNRGRGGFGGFGRTTTTEIETTAEPDERTNSVIVSTDKDKMPLIAAMIEKLDQDPARDQKLHIYEIKNGDPETIQTLLEAIISGQTGSGTGNRGNTNRNTNNSAFQQRGNTGNTGFGGGGFGGNTGGGRN